MSAETANEDRRRWTASQRRTAVAISLGFVVGTFVLGVVGPIALTVVIGLLQGHHRF
jgi:hypothetical protein